MATKQNKQKITGVAVRVQRMKTTVAAMVKYVLDLLLKKEKLYCDPLLRNLRLSPNELQNKSPKELEKIITERIERIIKHIPDNHEPVVEVIISLTPGQAWSPQQWVYFWREFLTRLSKVSYVKNLTARRSHSPQFHKVDLNRYPAVVGLHDNTASQHLQSMLVLVDPRYRQVTVVNKGFYKIAAQWAARETEKFIGLVPHPNMPVYEQAEEAGRYYIPRRSEPDDPDLPVGDVVAESDEVDNGVVDTAATKQIARIQLEVFKPSVTRSLFNNSQPRAVYLLSQLVKVSPPQSRLGFESLQKPLKYFCACLIHTEHMNLKFCVEGKYYNTDCIGKDWKAKNILKVWPEFNTPGFLVGMSPGNQKRRMATLRKARWKRAGISPDNPKPAELKAIVDTAEEIIRQLPWQQFAVTLHPRNDDPERLGTLGKPELVKKIKKLFLRIDPPLDQTLYFHPVSSEFLVLPLRGLSKWQVEQLKKQHVVALLTRTIRDNYDALILVKPTQGEIWEDKRALRRLTCQLAEQFQAEPNIVTDDGIPLPGLPKFDSFENAGCKVAFVEAQNQICPTATELLAAQAEAAAAEEKLFWQGAAGPILAHKDFEKLSKEVNSAIYCEMVKAQAENPLRCGSLEELNERIINRMKSSGYAEECIQVVLDQMKAALPELLEEILNKNSLGHKKYSTTRLRDGVKIWRKPVKSPIPEWKKKPEPDRRPALEKFFAKIVGKPLGLVSDVINDGIEAIDNLKREFKARAARSAATASSPSPPADFETNAVKAFDHGETATKNKSLQTTVKSVAEKKVVPPTQIQQSAENQQSETFTPPVDLSRKSSQASTPGLDSKKDKPFENPVESLDKKPVQAKTIDPSDAMAPKATKVEQADTRLAKTPSQPIAITSPESSTKTAAETPAELPAVLNRLPVTPAKKSESPEKSSQPPTPVDLENDPVFDVEAKQPNKLTLKQQYEAWKKMGDRLKKPREMSLTERTSAVQLLHEALNADQIAEFENWLSKIGASINTPAPTWLEKIVKTRTQEAFKTYEAYVKAKLDQKFQASQQGLPEH